VKLASKVYGATTVTHSRIGEVIIVLFGYSNKGHDGFLEILFWANGVILSR
jgi:hypothetical protein